MFEIAIEDLPEPIKRHIISQTARDKEYEDNSMGVTELLGCIRKTWYRRKFPKDVPLQHAWWFYRGNLLDEAWTTLFERNQVRATFRSRERVLTVSGRFDFMYEGAICDLKTTDGLTFIDKDGPKLEHIWQVMFYCWCNARTEARLYYVSFKDARVAIIKVTDEPQPKDEDEMFYIHVPNKAHREMIDSIELNAIMLHDALLANTPPDRLSGCIEKPETVSPSYWMCRYCEYSQECWKDADSGNTGRKDSAGKSKH